MSQPRKYKELDTQWSLRYARAKAQALYRNEGWRLSPLEYWNLWTNSGMTPGRHTSYGCMTRLDKSLPWSVDNVKIVPRRTHMKKNFIENCLKMPYVESEEDNYVSNH